MSAGFWFYNENTLNHKGRVWAIASWALVSMEISKKCDWRLVRKTVNDQLYKYFLALWTIHVLKGQQVLWHGVKRT